MQRLLQDTEIMKKILAMMLMLGIVAMLTAGVNAWKIRTVDARYSYLVERELPAIPLLVRSLGQVNEGVFNGLQLIAFSPGSEQFSRAESELRSGFADVSESLRKAEEVDPDLTGPVAHYRERARVIFDTIESAVQLSRSGQQAAAMQRLTEADTLMTELASDMVRSNDQRMAAAAEESDALATSTASNMLIALIVSILATGGALFMAHRVVKGSIVDPLLELDRQMGALARGEHAIVIRHIERKDEVGTMSRSVAVFRDQAEERARLEAEKKQADTEQQLVVRTLGSHLHRLAAGDVTAEISEQFPDGYEQLRSTFNAALRSLGELIASVTESAGQIRTGSSEIAQASEDLARRTEGNAASLEETSAAMAQMDERLKATARSSIETVGRADQAISTVTGGREVADEAVQAMNRVLESAKGIDDVIEGLDKIAFQTRVLAMNAAVEAGRAGEAGRGFAVVADLVSALAMRAEEEAKRARDQLTLTQTDIVTAVGAVEKVDAALAAISTDVGEVHQLLGSMAADNQAQASAVTEINSAIASMDQATQQNAAMVEETSAAARNLLSEVNGLAEQAGRFRMSGNGGEQLASRRTAAVSTVVKKAPSPALALPTPPPAQAKPRSPALPRVGKEGSYASPVKPLPVSAIGALTRAAIAEDDWKEF